MKRFVGYVLTTFALIGFVYQRHPSSQTNTVKELAPGVFFHEGDIKGRGHCNNGWVIFDDYVLVIDANFPSGAQEVIPKIKARPASQSASRSIHTTTAITRMEIRSGRTTAA